jgi:hypothetical protein
MTCLVWLRGLGIWFDIFFSWYDIRDLRGGGIPYYRQPRAPFKLHSPSPWRGFPALVHRQFWNLGPFEVGYVKMTVECSASALALLAST